MAVRGAGRLPLKPKQHGTRQCDNRLPHQAHRYDRTTNTWGCLGVKADKS